MSCQEQQEVPNFAIIFIYFKNYENAVQLNLQPVQLNGMRSALLNKMASRA